MNRIQLSTGDLTIAALCPPVLLHLCEVMQAAVDTLLADNHPKSSPQQADMNSLPADPEHSDMRLYVHSVLKPTITRGNFMMDNTLAVANLVDLVSQEHRRTAMGPMVLARSVLDAALAMDYYLRGENLEERLLRAYAVQLADAQEALETLALTTVVSGLDLDDATTEYLDLLESGKRRGYDVRPRHKDRRLNAAGVPNIVRVVAPNIGPVDVNPAPTQAARRAGTASLYQWKYGSGVTHGRIWAVENEYIQLEQGQSGSGLYIAATTAILQAVGIATKALASYTGHDAPSKELTEVCLGFTTQLSAVGIQLNKEKQ